MVSKMKGKTTKVQIHIGNDELNELYGEMAKIGFRTNNNIFLKAVQFFLFMCREIAVDKGSYKLLTVIDKDGQKREIILP